MDEVQSKYSRKGKLNEKMYARQLTLKIFMLRPKKIHIRKTIIQKFVWLENSPTPPRKLLVKSICYQPGLDYVSDPTATQAKSSRPPMLYGSHTPG